MPRVLTSGGTNWREAGNSWGWGKWEGPGDLFVSWAAARTKLVLAKRPNGDLRRIICRQTRRCPRVTIKTTSLHAFIPTSN